MFTKSLGTSSSSVNPVQPSRTLAKTPSSSESWSSVSSSELAVDPTNHKLYATHRRGGQNIQQLQQQRPHATVSPIESLSFHYEPNNSGSLVHQQSGRTTISLPPGVIAQSLSRPWQRNPRDVLSVLTESFLERRRLPTGPFGQGN